MHGIQDILNKGQEDGVDWVPGEADVSIRPGWFYSAATDDKVKTLPWLLDIYYASVGRNANLLLNVPVDRRGRIHKNDSLRLMEFRKALDADFKSNLAVKARISATNTRQNSMLTSAVYLADGNPNTYWATGEGQLQGSFTLSFVKPVTFNRLELQEFIALGQRVKAFTVSVQEGKEWREIAKETTIGYKRILRLPNTTTQSIRVDILDAKASPVISEVKVFKAPDRLADPVIKRSKDGMVSITCPSADPEIFYTLDGSEPTTRSARYTGTAFSFPQSGTVKAKAFIEEGRKSGATVTAAFDLAPSGWKALKTSSGDGEKAIDGDFQSSWQNQGGGYPHEIQVDMGKTISINGFSYTPRKNGGIIYTYAFYLSQDGQQWGEPVAKGSFANILNNPVKQTVKLVKPASARYFRLVAIAPADEKDSRAAAAEIGVF